MKKPHQNHKHPNDSIQKERIHELCSELADDITSLTDLSPNTTDATIDPAISVATRMNHDDSSLKPQTSQQTDHILVIIPCYNEETTIGSLIAKIQQYTNDIIIIDDGSTDETVTIASSLGATVLSHQKNLGKSAAIKTGFKYALGNGYDYIVTIDGDGQHNPHEIPHMIRALKKKHCDVLIGTRAGEATEMPFYRRIGKRVLDYATSLGNGGMVTDSQSGFRVYTKQALMDITPKLRGNEFTTESEQLMVAADLGFKVNTYPITCKYQSVGDRSMTSTKSPASHGFSVLGYVLWLVAEKRPLLFIGVPGFLFVLSGIITGILTIQVYNKTTVFPISYAVITGMLLMIGALGLFMGLLLNTFPHIVRRILDEKQMEEFIRQQDE